MSERRINTGNGGDFGVHRGVEAYPLHWPTGWERTPAEEREFSRFKRTERVPYSSGNGSYQRSLGMTIAEARKRLMGEFRAMTRVGHTYRVNPEEVVISSNVPVRLDGLPYSGFKEPADPGVAVYFHLDGVPHCLPCDKWRTVAGNLAAIAAHVNAMRGMERWGVGDVAATFAGFKALPPSGGSVIRPAMTAGQAAEWLAANCGHEVAAGVLLRSADELTRAFRAAVKLHHPDVGGSAEKFQMVQEAKRVIEQSIGGAA